jgi:putative iron-dependent peroxidase
MASGLAGRVDPGWRPAGPAVEDGAVLTDPAADTDVEPQAVLSPLTCAAIFLVVVAGPEQRSLGVIRRLFGDLPALVRAVGFRDNDGFLTCVTGVGAQLWDRLGTAERPAGLHPFQEIKAGGRHAVSTPGDILFHIRAARMDLCFELATQIMSRLGTAVCVVDEVHGFRYFDDRDLIGFVDGTENPVGAAARRAALIGEQDPAFAGGSYVIVQKYLHDLAAWDQIPVEEQERIVGRTKLADIELDDEVKPSYAHNALTTIERDGEEREILRDNMPFGAPGSGEYGTYFIGYCATPDTTEEMLRNMFIGLPEGNYDRLLDVSRAVTGTLFFVPSATLLESLAEEPPAMAERGSPAGEAAGTGPGAGAAGPGAGPAGTGPEAAAAARPGVSAGSLRIGSLKGAPPDE